MILILTEVVTSLLEKIISIGFEVCLEISIEEILYACGIFLTDMQKIKGILNDIVHSHVVQTIANFNDALAHLVVPAESRHAKCSMIDTSYAAPGIKPIPEPKAAAAAAAATIAASHFDSIKDARRYFKQAIISARKALSLKSTGYDDRILCMQIQFVSRLCVENFVGASSIIRNDIKEFVKNPETEKLFHFLAYDGANWDSKEMKNGYILWNLFANLVKINVIDKKFIAEHMHVSVARSSLNPLEIADRCRSSISYVDITNPCIKLKTTSKKAAEIALQVGSGITAVPISIGMGLLKSGIGIVLSPLLIPYCAIDAYIMSKKNMYKDDEKFFSDNFHEHMKYHLKYNICAAVTTPASMIALTMDETIGVSDFFKHNAPPDSYLRITG
jgi:hypothetical protein